MPKPEHITNYTLSICPKLRWKDFEFSLLKMANMVIYLFKTWERYILEIGFTSSQNRQLSKYLFLLYFISFMTRPG